MIRVDRVFLDLDNPRHKPFEDQDQAIAYLCKEERVLELARDIAENGLNPLELFALLKDGQNSFIVAEGNRRLCAIMLLSDPELAPANVRQKFSQLSFGWEPITHLFSVVLSDRDQVTLWLDRIHAGFNEGKGRRQWNSEQKTRNSGYSKNAFAQTLLDLGQVKGYITEEERKGRLSTVESFSRNPLFRDALGITNSEPTRISTALPEADFDVVFKRFMGDVAKQIITTRKGRDKDEIAAYANDLRNLEGVTGERVEQHVVVATKPKPNGSTRAKKPKKPTKIVPRLEISKALEQIPSYKLEKIYYSLCSFPVRDHTPLLYVGAWSFIETLTAAAGRKPKTDFQSFLSKAKLSQMGFSSDQKTLGEVIKRIAEHGNTTKHDETSAAFNGEQLINDMEKLKKLIVALAEEAKAKNT